MFPRMELVLLHVFPKDVTMFKKWEKVVAFKQKNWKASPHSCVCSVHFTADQFVDNSVKVQLGYGSRLLLAVLHYNENSGRLQATSKDGELQYNIAFPKVKKGGHTVKKVMTECTFGYVDELMLELMLIADGENEAEVIDAPPHLRSGFGRPEKSAVAKHFTRFPDVNSNST